MKAQTFTDILKFNPYHDSKGRFATANGYASFTYAPGKSKAHDMAIAREKERQAAAGAGSPEPKKQQYTEEEQIEAVKGFTIGDYFDIRKIQCGKDPGYMSAKELEKFKKKGEAIEEYIDANGPYKGAIYRGINTDGDEGFKVGQKIDMRGTSSWTTDKDQGYEWAGKNSNGDKGEYGFKSGKERAYVFQMKQAPKKSAYVDDISENKGEKEVIVSKNTRFKITGIEDSTERTVITVEEV